MNDPEMVPETNPATGPETLDEAPGQATETSESPTYKHDAWYGLNHYICLLCGHEDWSEPTLLQHMQAYHAGKMVVAPEGYEPPVMAEEEADMGEPREKPADTPDHPEHPHGPPPGQRGEHPEHPHGGPPGQEPHPEHPMVEPDEEEEEDKE